LPFIEKRFSSYKTVSLYYVKPNSFNGEGLPFIGEHWWKFKKMFSEYIKQ